MIANQTGVIPYAGSNPVTIFLLGFLLYFLYNREYGVVVAQLILAQRTHVRIVLFPFIYNFCYIYYNRGLSVNGNTTVLHTVVFGSIPEDSMINVIR